MYLHGVWIEEDCDAPLDETPAPVCSPPPSSSLSEFLAPMEISEETKAYIIFILNKNHQVHTVDDLKKLSGAEWNSMRVSNIFKVKIKSSPQLRSVITHSAGRRNSCI